MFCPERKLESVFNVGFHGAFNQREVLPSSLPTEPLCREPLLQVKGPCCASRFEKAFFEACFVGSILTIHLQS